MCDESLSSPQDHFKHEPLDLESSSIRLLRIIPAQDPKEQIQCELRLASTEEQYTCLSYVWGDPNKGQYILVNGHLLWIGQNLHDFLTSARKMRSLTTQYLWIDAICIDQTHTTEREHQVQQMGHIYSHAENVISWLGITWKIAAMLITYPGRANTLNQLLAYRDSPYWTRAWITQEIVLGRKLTLMVCDTILDITALPEPPSLRFVSEGAYENPVYRIGALRKHYQQKNARGKSLITLLNDFKFQQCRLNRDRVFSLLALCSDAQGLKVDYKISDAQLALSVMRCCPETFCLCALHILGDALQMPEEAQLAGDYEHRTGYGVVRLPMTWCNEENGWAGDVVEKTCGNMRWVGTCADTQSSHVVMYKPSLKTLGLALVSVTINMHELCSTYCGRVVIRAYVGREGCLFQYFGSFAPAEWNFEHCGGGVTLRLLEGTHTCEIAFSLEFWLQLARGAKRHTPSIHEQCCERGIGQRSRDMEDREVKLRLSSD
jgi:hypothetical protein